MFLFSKTFGSLFKIAFFVAFYDCSNNKGLGSILFVAAGFLHLLGSAFDYCFGVVFEVCGGNEIHSVEHSRVKAIEILFLDFDSVAVKVIQTVHSFHNLSAQPL